MLLHVKLFTELMEYALTIHCKFSCWMCKSLPTYGRKTETEGPSATFIIMELVHAATMHTDTTVLRVRVGVDVCGARESAFSTHATGLAVPAVPRKTGSVFSCSEVTTDNNEFGVANMTGFDLRVICNPRVIIRTKFDPTRWRSPFHWKLVGSTLKISPLDR